MKQILVVDDETPVRRVLERFLKEMGFDVIAAEDGPRALSQFRRHKPDMVLLDIVMPGINGIEVLRQMRQESPNACVIMLTALDDEEIGRKALEAGARDYLTKPIQFVQLETCLNVYGLLQDEA